MSTNISVPKASLLLLALAMAVSPASSQCNPAQCEPGITVVELVGQSTAGPEPVIKCSGYYCTAPRIVSVAIEPVVPNCVATNSSICTMVAVVDVEHPWNHKNTTCTGFSTMGWAQRLSDGRQCGIGAGQLFTVNSDFARYTMSRDTSCTTGPDRLDVKMCPGPSCVLTTQVPLDFAAAAGCVKPPPSACRAPGAGSGAAGEACDACVRVAGGCGIGVGGKGLSCTPENGGPGAFLHYQLMGPGHTGFPGSTAAWQSELGSYWSHDYATRLVPAGTSVWLITGEGAFIEFKGLAAGSGTRQYTQVSPSDEFRKLYLDDGFEGTANDGVGPWRLVSLDGRTDHFLSNGAATPLGQRGRWKKATFANDATPLEAFYHATTDRLLEVRQRDGRRELFIYQGDPDPGEGTGKLHKIIEEGTGWNLGPVPSRTWEYQWNAAGLVSSIGRPDGTGWEFTYHTAAGREGFLQQIRLVGTDLSGRVEGRFEYDAAGNVERTWRGSPNDDAAAVDQRSFAYVNRALPTSTTVTDALGNTTTYTIGRDSGGTKAKVVSRQGTCALSGCGPPSATYEYTIPGEPLLRAAMIDGNNVRTEYKYTTDGRMSELTEAKGTLEQRVTTWLYSTEFPGIVKEVERPSTDPTPGRFRVTTSVVDPISGNVSLRTSAGWEAGVAFTHATAMTYSLAGEVETVDPPGAADAVTYTYGVPDRNGHLPDSRIDPIVGATTFEYNAFNQRTKVTDPNGVATQTVYDTGPVAGGSVTLRRPREVRQLGASSPAQDLVTLYTYNALGDPFCVKQPEGNGVQYGYDAAGRLVEIVRGTAVATPDATTCLDTFPPRERVVYILDDAGNRIVEQLERAPGGGSFGAPDRRTTSVYSCHLDKVTQEHGSDAAQNSVTEYCYDPSGNLFQVWDPNRNRASNPSHPTLEYDYDELNRMVLLTARPQSGSADPVAVTKYEYDVQDHLDKITDAEGNVTTYTTSDRDLMTQQESSQVTGVTTYTYHPRGELATQTDARGVLVSRAVDALGRVTSEDYPGTALDTAFDYDGDGAALQPFRIGRLRSMTRSGQPSILFDYDRFGRITTDGELAYEYDDNANRTAIVYPGGVRADYGYDFADRQRTLQVTQGATPTQIVTAASYLAQGPLTSLSMGNGLTETRSFDGRYFPDIIQVAPTGGGASKLHWDYTVDKVGNPTAIDNLLGTDDRAFAYSFQYFQQTATGPWGTRQWTYDRIGNRLSEGADLYTYYPNAAVPVGRTPKLQKLGPAGSEDLFTHDAAGNSVLASGRSRELEMSYDPQGRLVGLTDGVEGAVSTLTLDARGFLRESRQSGDACVPAVTQATYGSDGVLYQRRRYDVLGNATSSVSVVYFAGRPVAQLETLPSAGYRYLTTDHLGTPVLMLDSTGANVLWSGGFEPFGRDWQAGTSQGASESGLFLRLPGQWTDPTWSTAGGLYYNLYRWYEPATGRYTSPDPLTDGALSPYSYALNRPLSIFDPLGLFEVIEHPPASGPIPECGGGTRAGCGGFDIGNNINCLCTMVDCKWRSLVWIHPEPVYHIFYRTDCARSATDILTHERTHATDDAPGRLDRARRVALKASEEEYDTEAECGRACDQIRDEIVSAAGPTGFERRVHGFFSSSPGCPR
jgi:RHS repeat-associated protein